MGADQPDESTDGRTYLHLRMRPVSPPTYVPRRLSAVNIVLITIGALVTAYFLVVILSLLAYALVAGDPG